jgi:hypothetical protein
MLRIFRRDVGDAVPYITGVFESQKIKKEQTPQRDLFWYARRDSFAFSPGNGRKQMCGSVEPSPAALIRAAF